MILSHPLKLQRMMSPKMGQDPPKKEAGVFSSSSHYFSGAKYEFFGGVSTFASRIRFSPILGLKRFCLFSCHGWEFLVRKKKPGVILATSCNVDMSNPVDFSGPTLSNAVEISSDAPVDIS